MDAEGRKAVMDKADIVAGELEEIIIPTASDNNFALIAGCKRTTGPKTTRIDFP